MVNKYLKLYSMWLRLYWLWLLRDIVMVILTQQWFVVVVGIGV